MGEPAKHFDASDHTADPAHEVSDVRIRPLGVFLAVLTTSLVVVILLTASLFRILMKYSDSSGNGEPFAAAPADSSSVPPGPLLQISPREDLERMLARDEQQLHTLEWVDQERGLVRMPIERAMELAAKQPFPEWPESEIGQPSTNGGEPTDPAAAQGSGVNAPETQQ